jgi:hypothetical protein
VNLLNRLAISPTLLKSFIYGEDTIDVYQMAHAMVWDGYSPEIHPQPEWLHGFLETASEQDRRAFLRLVTGSSQLPVGGFEHLVTSINIVRVNPERQPLPGSDSVAAFSLRLPSFADKETFNQRLHTVLAYIS